MSYVANARMYSVNPGAASAWKELFAWLARKSGVDLRVIDHAFPSPLAELWSRPDLGCAFMCGLPYARDPRPLTPIDPDLVGKLQAAFKAAARADALEAERDMLLIADFVVPERAVYEALRARAEAAAAYPDVW